MKTCTKCGKILDDEITVCDSCGTGQNTKSAETAPIISKPVKKAGAKTAAEKYPLLHVIKGIGSSKLFFIGNIIFSLYAVMNFIGMFDKKNVFAGLNSVIGAGKSNIFIQSQAAFADTVNSDLLSLLTGLAFVLPMLLIAAALWLFYFNCRSKKYHSFSPVPVKLFRGAVLFKFIISVCVTVFVFFLIFNNQILEARIAESKSGGEGGDMMPSDQFNNGGMAFRGSIVESLFSKLSIVSEKQAVKVAEKAAADTPAVDIAAEDPDKALLAAEGDADEAVIADDALIADETDAGDEAAVQDDMLIGGGDVNGDGVVDDLDLNIGAGGIDTNGDGIINEFDIQSGGVDTNGDGVINELDGQAPTPVDLNGDGIIDESEMAAAAETTTETPIMTERDRSTVNILLFMIFGAIAAYIMILYSTTLRFAKIINNTIEDEVANKGTPASVLFLFCVTIIAGIVMFILAIKTKQPFFGVISPLLSIASAAVYGLSALRYKFLMQNLNGENSEEI